MTANRWWVKVAARWLARIDGVKGLVQMVSLAVTAFSTFSIMLQGFGLGFLVPYLGVTCLIVGPVFIYLYAEGGVWNQVARDRQDLSADFAGPNVKIQAEMNARTYTAARMARELTEEERQAVKRENNAAFIDNRNGTDLNPNDD